MAKELIFKLNGTDYGSAPVKLERKKIYGWTDVVATDRSGSVCGSAYLSPDDEVLPNLPSSFDAPIELKLKATAEEFLDNDWEAVYQLVNADLATAVGDDIYKFEFSYRGGTNHNDGYLINTPGGLFLFAGDRQEFPLVSLAEETTIDDTEEPVEEEIDELDFSMF